MKNNPVPPAFSRWSSLDELTEQNQQSLTKLLDKAAANAAASQANATTKMLGNFYSACMDSAAVEKLGAAPLKPRLARIDAITTRADLQREIARLHREGT
jgi:endothelin-converting enzyme/putative endopeptidase